jgi:cytochrome c oxidase assembly factor CtaG
MRLSSKIGLGVAALTLNGEVFAHQIETPPGDSLPRLVLIGWTAEASTLIPLAIAFFWYTAGVQRAIAEGKAKAISPARLIAFAGGMIVMAIALQSPIDIISEDLFSVHMIQHLLLMLAAPPLFVWSDCPIVFLRALPRRARKAVAHFWARSAVSRTYHGLTHPVAVWGAFCGAFVFWHAPRPYEWALADNRVHIVEHLSFFVTSLAFWSIVLPPNIRRRRLQHGPTLLLVVSTAVLGGLPGALMIFAPRPLYPVHAAGVARWGLTLMQDQQIAGLIMWIPAGAAYVLAATLVFLQWLREAEARAVRSARHSAAMTLLISLASLPLVGCNQKDDATIANFSGQAARGASLIDKYGCGGCHTIPDVANAKGNVGPPLNQVGSRVYIAGLLRNSPDNMALWIQDPQKVLPGNAMPAMGISSKEARDITAFLYTLK